MTIDGLLLQIFPYVAVTLMVVVGIYRNVNDRFTYSSLSSQFLENGKLFWGAVPWHYGIITVLTGHLIGFLIPIGVKAWNGVPVRLYILEITALSFGLMALFGLITLIVRRLSEPRVQVVTTGMDVILLLLLLVQAVTGVWTAMFYRWGSNWFVGAAVPYLYSLFQFNPQIGYVTSLPLVTKIHIYNFWALCAIFPFTRLVHLVSLPFTYVTRPYQQVVWYRRDIPSRPQPAAVPSVSSGLGVPTGYGGSDFWGNMTPTGWKGAIHDNASVKRSVNM